MTIKVLHIGKYYDPYHGGIETVVKNICQGIASHEDIELEILCSNDRFKSSVDIVNGIKVTRMARLLNIASQAINPLAFFKILKMAKKFDIIHIHSPNPIIELISLFLPKTQKIMVTYHSDVVRQKFLLKFYKPILRAYLKRADIISVATQNHIRYSSYLPEFADKCTIIPFSIDESLADRTNQINNQVTKIQKAYGNFALYVGRLVEYKGLHILIDAISRSQDLKVIIVGSGPLEQALKDQVKALSLEAQVIFQGRVDDDDKFKAFYHACELVVLPSITINENFGMIQLEAMLCKKAVVTTNLKSGVPVVGEVGKTCLLVEPGNSNRLYKALQLLFNNKELSKQMGIRGFQRFNNLFTSKRVNQLHLDIYNQLNESEQSQTALPNIKKSA